jgi:hypothetical protein
VDPKVIIRKGKASQGERFTAEPGNSPPPSIKTPFSYSQLPSKPISEVSRFLNFGSVPAEFSPPDLALEEEILVTPLSPKAVPWYRPRTSEYFTTPPLLSITAQRGASAHSGPLALSSYSPLFPFPPRSSFLVSPVRTPSPPSYPPLNIPMAGVNPLMTRMEAIIVVLGPNNSLYIFTKFREPLVES